MDMVSALVARLEWLIAAGKLDAEQRAKAVDELHRVRRRVVKPRDASRDNEPITVGILKDDQDHHLQDSNSGRAKAVKRPVAPKAKRRTAAQGRVP